MPLSLLLGAASGLGLGAALFLFRSLIIEKERRRADEKLASQKIEALKAMVIVRDRLADPDAVERVLDAFAGGDLPAGGADHGDGGDPGAA